MKAVDADKLAEKTIVVQNSIHPELRFFIIPIDVAKTLKIVDAVELPCKIGDKVWIARRYKCHKRPRWGIVSEMFFTDDMELCIVVKGVARGKWGVDVFATYEEAETQIERNNRKD